MDFKMQRVIIYGIGTFFVFLWAVLNVIPYFMAMIMASEAYAIALVLEAREAHIHHDEKTYYRKMLWAALIIALSFVLIVFK